MTCFLTCLIKNSTVMARTNLGHILEHSIMMKKSTIQYNPGLQTCITNLYSLVHWWFSSAVSATLTLALCEYIHFKTATLYQSKMFCGSQQGDLQFAEFLELDFLCFFCWKKRQRNFTVNFTSTSGFCCWFFWPMRSSGSIMKHSKLKFHSQGHWSGRNFCHWET